MAKLSLCAQLHIVKKGSTFLNFKLQKFHSAFTQKEQISPILSSTPAIAIMEKFHQNVSIWSLWQRQLYCFLKTMHLEESWSIDIEALLCSKVLARNSACFLLTCDGSSFKFKGNSVAL